MEAHTLLKQVPLFAQLESARLKRFAGKCETKIYASEEMMARASFPVTHLLFVATGRVAIYRRNAERKLSLLLGIAKGPALLGDMEWFSGAPWAISIRALEDCWCVHINPKAFEALVASDAKLAFELYRDASRRHHQANMTAQSIALLATEARILRLLLDLAEPAQENVEHIVTQPITQVELAAWLGIHRRTVIRAFEQFEKEGIATRRDDGRVAITRSRKLEEYLPPDTVGLTSSVHAEPSPLVARWLTGEPNDVG